jgi:hypothetical protein
VQLVDRRQRALQRGVRVHAVQVEQPDAVHGEGGGGGCELLQQRVLLEGELRVSLGRDVEGESGAGEGRAERALGGAVAVNPGRVQLRHSECGQCGEGRSAVGLVQPLPKAGPERLAAPDQPDTVPEAACGRHISSLLTRVVLGSCYGTFEFASGGRTTATDATSESCVAPCSVILGG